jgi:hypothetical protein
MRSILRDAIYRKHKECNCTIRFIPLHSQGVRIPLHSWEMEFSIQYHVTVNSQLNDQNSIRYYIIVSIVFCNMELSDDILV